MALIETDFGATAQPETPSRTSTTASNDTIGMLVYALWRSRWFLMGIVALGIFLGFVAGAIRPNVFEATGKLLLRVGIREGSTAETGVTSESMSSAGRGRDAMFTELELLASPELYQKVIDTIGAKRIVEFIDPTDFDDEDTSDITKMLHRFQSWWFKSAAGGDEEGIDYNEAAQVVLENGLLIDIAGYSSVFNISYQGQDKYLAKEIVDAYMRAAEEHHRAAFSTRAQLSFLKERLKDAQKKASLIHQKLIGYEKKWEIFDIEFQMNGLLTSMAALQSKMDTAEDLMESLRQRRDHLKRVIEGEDTERAQLLGKIPNPEIAKLEKELFEWRRLRLGGGSVGQGLSSYSTEQRNKTIDGEIARLRKKISETPQFRKGEANLASFLTEQYDISSNLLANAQVLKKQGERMAAMKKRLQELQQAEADLQNLQSEYTQAKHDVDNFTMQFERLNLIGLLDEQKMGNLRVLQEATMSRYKVSPKRGKFLAVGLILSLGIGVVLAFARVLLDTRVRRPTELLALTSRSVLGVIKEKRRSHHQAPKTLQDTIWYPLVKSEGGGGDRRFGVLRDAERSDEGLVATSTARSLARWTGKSVLVIETDFDTPLLAARLGVGAGPGLSHALEGTSTIEEAVQSTQTPNLSVIAIGDGPSADAGWHTSPRAQALLKEIFTKFHYVVFDLPPWDADPETRYFLDQVDSIVLVTRAGLSSKRSLKSLAESLSAAHIPIVGVVLNGYRSVRPFWVPGTDPELRDIPS